VGSASNPLTGSGWLSNAPGTATPGSGGGGGGPNWANPGWALGPVGGLIGSMFGSGSPPPNPQNSPTSVGGPWGNPGGYQNPWGSGEIRLNAGLNNILAGQMKNQLAPQFAQLMQQYGGDAGKFYQQLMNLGSPYYQQKQMEGFTQGNQQNQNAQGMARQQLGAQGYGSTPSGANAAMIGGMNQQGSQNLSEQYLQNLFNNEQMQLQGGAGLSNLTGMFNPTQLLGGTSIGSNIQGPTSLFQNLATTMGALGAGGQGAGAAMTGAGNL
jgi:hypothetical protein